MADLTLPGTISGLIRRCSPVVVTGGRYAGRRGIVVDDPDGCPGVLVVLDADNIEDVTLQVVALTDLALELSDSPGAIQALWWLTAARERGAAMPEHDRLAHVATVMGIWGGDALSDVERAEFRRVCLRVAGVSDAD